MFRFDGSSILIVDMDRLFGMQLSEVLTSAGARSVYAGSIAECKNLLKTYDFDIVVSNYYLTDGIIHQLIDWCEKNVKSMPIFTAMGYPLPGDADLSQKHSIADVFSKNDRNRILAGISNLLFDINQFHGSLLEMLDPNEVMIEMKVNSQRLLVRPIEISQDSIFLSINQDFEPGSFGIMNFSLNDKNQIHNFVIPGYFAAKSSGGQHFRINRTYHGHWQNFLDRMQAKQMDISTFMKKAAGY